ncbi:MAG: class I SAM-dependent methyltransferase [Bacteroidetes bacterium]|nr:class I SAM-dependent methyltransferase [Bacteroidota bacterium]
MKEFWNQRYREPQYAYGTSPNMFFRMQLKTLSPGKLYLPGEGEGRNAVHAAREGWDVHAVDYSVEAKRKALALAADAGVSISYTVADITSYRLPAKNFDAAASVFLHLPKEQRRLTHAAMEHTLKSGGTLILEAFAKEQLSRDTGGPKQSELLYATDELIQDFSRMEIVHQFAGEADILEGRYHTGPSAVVRLVLRKR